MRCLLIALLLPLAGCLEPSTSRGLPGSCEALAALGPSGNAPLADALARSPHEVAAALAQAVGDPWTGNVSVGPTVVGSENATRYETRGGGVVEHFALEGVRFGVMLWWGRAHFTPIDGRSAEEDFERVLTNIGLPPHVRGNVTVHASEGRLDGETRPSFAADEYSVLDLRQNAGARFWENAGTEAVGEYVAQVSLSDIHDVSRVQTRFTDEDAARIAELAASCSGVADGRAGVPSWAIVDDSMTRAVPVGYAGPACEDQRMRTVFVDVETGAALRIGDEQSACVY